MENHQRIAPKARMAGLVVETLGDEVLIYDTARDRAHNLNRTAALVWELSNGKRTPMGIAQLTGQKLGQPVHEQAVWYALAQLDEYHLLETSVQLPAAIQGMTRREFIKKFALPAAIVPVVKTLKVPELALQASCVACNQTCNPTGTACCSPCSCNPSTNMCEQIAKPPRSGRNRGV